MADCTRSSRRSHPFRRSTLLAVGTTIVALAMAFAPPPALADGDPASDVLVAQPVFLPQDSGASAEQQAQLGAIATEAQKSGYPIRVALIATATDLGSIGALWRQPQSYAEFLGQELSLVYRGTLLVVMPNGFGLYPADAQTAATRAALAGIGTPAPGGLVGVTISAIERLAAASGHTLQAPAGSNQPGVAGSHVASWLALALGAAVIAAAWAASLRAKPVRLGSGGSAEAS